MVWGRRDVDVMEKGEGLKHRFMLTLLRMDLMKGKPVYFWDPNLNDGWGETIMFFLEDEE
jgi:hypothetical protein